LTVDKTLPPSFEPTLLHRAASKVPLQGLETEERNKEKGSAFAKVSSFPFLLWLLSLLFLLLRAG
jgi:hypothetical protein